MNQPAVNPNERASGEGRNLGRQGVVFVRLVANYRARVGDLNVTRLVAKNYKLDALLIAQLLNPAAKNNRPILASCQILYESAVTHVILAFLLSVA